MENLKKDIKPVIHKQDPKDHLANERTLLAWVRTSIAIMAFGFVVVKFSLFVTQISLLLGRKSTIPQHGSSSILGIFLVIVGVIVLIVAYINYKRIRKQLIDQTFIPSSRLTLSLILTLLVVSILLILYLVQSISGY